MGMNLALSLSYIREWPDEVITGPVNVSSYNARPAMWLWFSKLGTHIYNVLIDLFEIH